MSIPLLVQRIVLLSQEVLRTGSPSKRVDVVWKNRYYVHMLLTWLYIARPVVYYFYGDENENSDSNE